MNVTKTIFEIPKMDCPSEEKLIRMALGEVTTKYKLDFDFQARILTVYHMGSPEHFFNLLNPLKLGAKITGSTAEEVTEEFWTDEVNKGESKVLKTLLLINGGMFIVEIVFGLIAESTGLIADAMDMFADAAVYSLSLYAVGHTLKKQRKAAKLSGYFQMLLAIGVGAEVVRRFLFGSEPEPFYMIGVAIIALVANVTCMLLLTKHRGGGVHMKASWIFSTNDVIANTGVIVAGLLVSVTASPLPDLIIGGIIAIVVFRGALQILKLSRPSRESKTLTTMED